MAALTFWYSELLTTETLVKPSFLATVMNGSLGKSGCMQMKSKSYVVVPFLSMSVWEMLLEKLSLLDSNLRTHFMGRWSERLGFRLNIVSYLHT